ncbi:hypothetical protein ACR6C2_04050 [Streptomyces sp. INA 01156]
MKRGSVARAGLTAVAVVAMLTVSGCREEYTGLPDPDAPRAVRCPSPRRRRLRRSKAVRGPWWTPRAGGLDKLGETGP